MKTEITERFSPQVSRVSVFLFVQLNGQYDNLYVGTENGKLMYFPILSVQIPHNIRPIEISKDSTQHSAEVTCLMYSDNVRFIGAHCHGLAFSGSLDRSIKVWNNDVSSGCLVQTLFGHSGSITAIVDGRDGTVLSTSEDGSLRVWMPQRGRAMMLNPFFECSFILNLNRDVWLSALAISNSGLWICYVADSQGGIEVLKKGSDHNEVERGVVAFSGGLTSHCRWERVHALGITRLEVVREENVLVSLSFDGSAKIIDPSGGQVLFTILNPRRGLFTGLTWSHSTACLLLTDEFGFLEMFSLFHEKVTESVCLVPLSSKQGADVLKNHSGQALGAISQFSHDGYYFALVSTPRRKSAISNSSTSTLSRKTVGVLGDVLLWNIVSDGKCLEFVGHEGSIVSLGVPNFDRGMRHLDIGDGQMEERGNSKRQQQLQESKMGSVLQRVSAEEKLFFSVGHEDCTLRCWDEYDQSESYQFKSKGNSEITVMLVLWAMNRIATGHESGLMCLWNSDTGTKVFSKALKQSVSSLVEGSNSHSKLLIGADFGGSVAVWNLTLHALNPTSLQVESSFPGFHDPEDPGILSLAFHEQTRTVFSGGNDCTIKMWRIQNCDVSLGSSQFHQESVCIMKCTRGFLLSGDEEGYLSLSKIVLNEGNGAQSTISRLVQFCSWLSLIPSRSIADICEYKVQGDMSRAYVAQVSSGGRTKVWEICTQPRKTSTNHGAHRTGISLEDVMRTSSQFGQGGRDGHQQDGATAPSAFEALTIYSVNHPDLYMAVSELCSVTHEKHEVSCCALTYTAEQDGAVNIPFKQVCLLYIGTVSGIILRYNF
jgi:WD40 repeat protein